MAKTRHYAGDDMPNGLRLAANELLDEARKLLESKGFTDISTAELMGTACIAINEVNREITYGLWKDGEFDGQS